MLHESDFGRQCALSTWQRRFLVKYSECWKIDEAVLGTQGYTIQDHYKSLDDTDNPEYRQWWDAIQRGISDSIEEEAVRRAVKGVPEPIVFKGKVSDEYVIKYSDSLLAKVLAARLPAYGAKPQDQSGADGSEKGNRIVVLLPDNQREQVTLDSLREASLNAVSTKELQPVRKTEQ